MKCICGYEKVPGKYVQTPILFSKGKNKGEVKSYYNEWYDPDSDKPDFIAFKLTSTYDRVYDVLVCPTCGTTKVLV